MLHATCHMAHFLLCLQGIPPRIVHTAIHPFLLCCSSPCLFLKRISDLHYLQVHIILLCTIFSTRLYKFQLSSEVSGPLNKALADNAMKDAISCLGIGDILLLFMYCTVLYCTVLYYAVLYFIALYCPEVCFAMLSYMTTNTSTIK